MQRLFKSVFRKRGQSRRVDLICRVSSIWQAERQERLGKLCVGQALTLERDPKSTIDPNTVKVMLGTEQVGFLDREAAAAAAPRLDAGESLTCDVHEVTVRKDGLGLTVRLRSV